MYTLIVDCGPVNVGVFEIVKPTGIVRVGLGVGVTDTVTVASIVGV